MKLAETKKQSVRGAGRARSYQANVLKRETPKEPKKGLVGTAQPIHDALGKATGRTRYAADYKLAGMAHLATVFSTVPHAYVRHIDDSAARAQEGVYAVFHALNTPEYRFNRYRSQFTNKGAQELPLEECVFHRHVRFVGDRIAVVAARDEETARYAASLIKVEYKELPFALDFDAALEGRHCVGDEKAVPDEGAIVVGTPHPEEAGGIVVTSHSEISRLHHAAMEPHVCIADYDAAADELTIWCPNQASFGIRTVIADMLQMSYNKVRVIKTTMGGSFGCKQEWYLEPACALAAKLLKRPVKMVYTREETMRSTCCRAAMRADLVGVFKPDGTILRLDMDVIIDAGAYMGNGRDYCRAPFGKLFRCYRIPYSNLHCRVVQTNTTPNGAFRSWGVAEYFVMVEHLMDKAAKRLGIDPVELRLRNVLLPGESDIKMGLPAENTRTRECLLKGREKFQWERKRREDRAFNQANHRYKRGVGIACAGHTNTYYTRFNDFAGAEARMCDDGSVQASVSIHDHGCGTVQAFRMILSDVLELPIELIRMGEADTAYTPYDYGCFSSRSTFMIGRAVEECGKSLRKELLATAAQMLETNESEVYIENGAIRRRGGETVYSYREVAQWCMLYRRKEIFADARHYNTTNPVVTGTHFSHVEVDTWTGITKVLDYLALHDIGQAINPGICISQTQGAIQMGCGAALREEITYNAKGRGTVSLSKYHLMNAPDLPQIQVELIESGPSKEGPFGAKSIGEVGMAPVAACVANAVNQALDADLPVIPMSPDRIMAYMMAKEA